MIMHASGHRRLYTSFLLGALILAPCWVPASAQASSAKAAPLTEKDSVVLADFDNKTGDAVFDDALTQALAMEFGQSPFLNLISDRKVSEALRAMGRPADAHFTADVARELCQRTGSKAVLGGTISKLSGHYQLGLTVTACATGDTLAEERGEAAGKGSAGKTSSTAPDSSPARSLSASASLSITAPRPRLTTPA